MTKKTILIAEDDDTLRGILVEKLTQSGFIVIPAENGQIAIDTLRARPVDLVLLDIIMPKKNGMEVLEEMHGDANLKKIPVVVISNSGQPVEMDRAKELGAKDFLVKAVFDPREVLDKIAQFLGPLPAPSSTEPSVSKTGAPASSGDKLVLVVEDDKFLRELLIEKLISSGINVLGAQDGKTAFKTLETARPALIVLDLILPDMNGFEILAGIRSNRAVDKTPVLILSNLDQKEDLDRAHKLGVSGFMIKANFSLGEIVTKINSIIGKK